MIAYHFPPARISSGIQRTLKFSTYLLGLGWLPSILTVHPRAYETTGDDQLAELPADLCVNRAFALDTARHLALAGRYLGGMALPDRWVSWWLGGVVSGMGMVRRERPDVLWSTYPIATAHLIALTLNRLTGVPWVADFRDSMTEEKYPADPRQRKVYLWIERQVVRRADRIVFTTPGTRRMYAERYPDVPAEKWCVIPNGFDEQNFQDAETIYAKRVAGEPVKLVHSGILYPSERDPTRFFQALAELKALGFFESNPLRVTLRATAHDGLFAPIIEEMDIGDIVQLRPAVAYREALSEMLSSDGLLLFQATNCNHQIPAKLYEYLRARRPVLALTDPAGDTAATMLDAGITTIVRLDDMEAIKTALRNFITMIDEGAAPLATDEAISRYSREAGSRDLARVLDEVSGANRSAVLT